MFRQNGERMTNLEIAIVIVMLALAGWGPAKQQKTAIVRAVAAAVMKLRRRGAARRRRLRDRMPELPEVERVHLHLGMTRDLAA